jgi:high affinity Mn2+ porin
MTGAKPLSLDWRIARRLVATLALTALAAQAPVRADTPSAADQALAVHGQYTLVVQGWAASPRPMPATTASRRSQVKETSTPRSISACALAGAEIWVNPEIDQGFGLSNTLGAGGFPSAEAYKVGQFSPYFKLQRAFVRQTIALGGAALAMAPGINQLRLATTANRLVITAGKMGVGDVFDTNRYAHDPRGDFLNWSLVDTGSFDYAANAWGYTYGVAAEWYQGVGAAGRALQPVQGAQWRGPGKRLLAKCPDRGGRAPLRLAGHPGAVRVTVFRNRGQFARFDDALAYASAHGQVPTWRRCAAARIGWASPSTPSRK